MNPLLTFCTPKRVKTNPFTTHHKNPPLKRKLSFYKITAFLSSLQHSPLHSFHLSYFPITSFKYSLRKAKSYVYNNYINKPSLTISVRTTIPVTLDEHQLLVRYSRTTFRLKAKQITSLGTRSKASSRSNNTEKYMNLTFQLVFLEQTQYRQSFSRKLIPRVFLH